MQLVDVNVRLVRSVEQDHSGSTVRFQLVDQCRQVRSILAQFDSDRDGNDLLDHPQDTDIILFDLIPFAVYLRFQQQQVEFYRIRTRFLQAGSKLNPGISPVAIDTCDDRNLACLLGITD